MIQLFPVSKASSCNSPGFQLWTASVSQELGTVVHPLLVQSRNAEEAQHNGGPSEHSESLVALKEPCAQQQHSQASQQSPTKVWATAESVLMLAMCGVFVHHFFFPLVQTWVAI